MNNRSEAPSIPGQPTSVLSRLATSRVLGLVVLGGLILLFFHKMAFSNLILARGDTYLYFYPYWQAAADAMHGGRIPLWNPDIFMGAPFLANSQVGFFYPLNWPVWLLLPIPYAVSASILIHLFIAGLGAYLAGKRTLGLNDGAALFAAALFALGGYLTAQVEHINQLQGLAWLPWLFVAVAPLVHTVANPGRKDLSIILSVGVLFALQLLAGHTQTVFISGVAISLWLTVHALQRRGRRRLTTLAWMAALLLAGVALAVTLASAQLLPTIELTGQSSRQGGLPINDVLSFSWNPVHLARALLPGYDQSLFTEYVAFLPLTALALAVAGAWSWRKNPSLRPWLALVLIALVLALGGYTPVYHLLGRLPGFNLFRAPARWLVVAAFGAALLAGHGWQRLWWYANREAAGIAAHEDTRRELIRPFLFAAAGLFLLVLWGYVAGWVAEFLPGGAEAPFERPAPLSLIGWLIELVLAVLVLWVILTATTARARQATIELAILVLAVLWIGSRGLPYNQLTTPEAYFDLRPPQARLLALTTCAVPESGCESPPGRLLSLSDIFFDPGDLAEIDSIYADQLPPEAIYDYVVAIKNKEVVSPNLSMLTGTPSVDGFDGGILPLRSYSELMSLILPVGSATTDGRLREYLDASPDARWLSLFNGRYLITDKTADVWREGVFFDRQHPVEVATEPLAITEVPDFEATELWLIAGATPPEIEVQASNGESWRLAAELLAAPDLYRVAWPRPAKAEAILLLPCEEDRPECSVDAATLVDSRDKSFQSLTFVPYRLIYSGDVKIYENRAAQDRAFIVHDWLMAVGTGEAIDIMRTTEFNPTTTAVVIDDKTIPAPPGSGSGSTEITGYSPERITIRAESDRDSLLVLTDANYPGWEVTIDGKSAAVRQVNGLFRGVFLSAGAHEVVFSYHPSSYRIGAIISIFSLLLTLGLSITLLIQSHRGNQAIGFIYPGTTKNIED